jgi:prolyl-tRNA synthetase
MTTTRPVPGDARGVHLRYARTDETHDPGLFATGPRGTAPQLARGIEVGQIFYFGTKYSEAMGAMVTDHDGNRVPVHMGSHGIGVSAWWARSSRRAMTKRHHLARGRDAVPCGHRQPQAGRRGDDTACEELYGALTGMGLEPLYDDRDERAGAKFATMDLIGLPWRITVTPGTARIHAPGRGPGG